MADTTRDSDRLIEEGRRLRDDNRAGGRHRRVKSIGEGSKGLKRENRALRLKLFFGTVFAILAGASVFGAFVSALGFGGVMIVAMALFLTLVIFAQFPKVKIPKRADLTRSQDIRQLVARTELWLEHQRAALPPPAVKVVEDMGVQLDALGKQLEHVPADHEAAREIRQLVGETLPEMVDSYTRIPQHLRHETRAGSSPDQQVTDGLKRIGREIDNVTRQLAEGSLDDLAVKHRYLDYKYGAGPEGGRALTDNQGSGVPLPDFNRETTRSPG